MKNLSCEIENFGIIKNFKHAFKDGITVLSGENGQGKSTVLKSLDMNLFDRYPETLDDYLSWDVPPEETSFKHTWSFEHRGHSFSSMMKYDGKSRSTTRELYIDGATTPYKNSEATKKLAEHLDPKMDPPALIARQKDKGAVDVSPSERREHMRKAFDVNFPEEVKELQALESQVELKIAETDKKLVQVQAQKFEPVELPPLPLTDEEVIKAQKDVDRLRGEISVIEGVVTQYQNKKDKVLRKTNRAQVLADARDKLTIEITEKDQALKDHQPVEKLPTMISIEDQLRVKNELLITKNLDKSNLENEVVQLQEQSAKIVLERLPQFDRKSLDEALALITDATSKLTRVQSDLDSLNKGICPTCSQPLTDPGKISSLEVDKKNLTDQIAGWSTKRDEQNVLLAAHQQLVDSQNRLRDERSRIDSQVSQKQAQVTSMVSEISQLNAGVSSLVGQKDKLVTDHGWTKTNLESKLVELRAALPIKHQELLDADIERDAVVQELARLVDPSQQQADVIRLKGEIEIITGHLREQEQVQARRTVLIEQNEKTEKARVDNLIEQEKLTAERQTLGSELADLVTARVAFQKDLPTFIVLKKVENISREVNEFLRKTYAGRYQIKFVNKKDSLMMLYGPRDKDVKLASGYEAQVFSMAYQIALNKLQDLDFLILDEVDSQASERSSLLFYKVLAETQDAVRTKIIVSHKKVTKDLLSLDFGAEIIEFENGVAS